MLSTTGTPRGRSACRRHLFRGFLAAAVLLCLQFAACSGVGPGGSLPRGEPLPSKAEHLTDQGLFREALKEYRSIHAQSPDDQEILASYRAAVGKILSEADAAFARDDFVAAGRSYRLLFERYPDFGIFAVPLAFDRSSLRTKIEACTTQLTNRGLERYRRGDIKAAIALWQGILAFEPDNVEIRKAIDNAGAQEKNLEKTP